MGVLLLALWLGWTLPALWALRPAPPPTQWTAAQVLAQVPGALRATVSGPLLLQGNSGCGCPSAAASLPSVRDGGHAPALPFDWVVLDAGQRLVYAGPAQIARACGRGTLSALPLVERLLGSRQAAVILSDSCSCSQE